MLTHFVRYKAHGLREEANWAIPRIHKTNSSHQNLFNSKLFWSPFKIPQKPWTRMSAKDARRCLPFTLLFFFLSPLPEKIGLVLTWLSWDPIQILFQDFYRSSCGEQGHATHVTRTVTSKSLSKLKPRKKEKKNSLHATTESPKMSALCSHLRGYIKPTHWMEKTNLPNVRKIPTLHILKIN